MLGCIEFEPARASTGKIGCDESDINISNDNFDDLGTRTWVATCRGKRYQCSRTHLGKGGDISCTAMDEEADVEARPVASGPTIWSRVDKGDYSFEKPGSWTGDATSYRSADDEHALRVNRYKLKGRSFDTFVSETFPAYEITPIAKGEEGGVIASSHEGLGQITSAAIERAGTVFVLTCEDFSEKKTSALCVRILRSFRVEQK
jgi:hypothetical protein